MPTELLPKCDPPRDGRRAASFLRHLESTWKKASRLGYGRLATARLRLPHLEGKYTSHFDYAAAWAYRKYIRAQLRGLVQWPTGAELHPGCTALIGMCSAMPDVLLGNLSCLRDHAWPDLVEVIVVADTTEDRVSPALERDAAKIVAPIPLRFMHHDRRQNRTTERLCLPYVYCWLSWCVALGACRTRTALLHDYDALVLSDRLGERYEEFVASNALMQGIRWYDGNGICPDDRLATTFEAFLDVAWVRRHHPIHLFNELRIVRGRSRDHDILLDLQHDQAAPARRTVARMREDDLVHPSQMVHQHTMFRRHPGEALPSYSIPMIPFFEYLHAGPEPIERSIDQIRRRAPGSKTFSFLADQLLVNFGLLRTGQVDWSLKQMVQVCVQRDITPDPRLYLYGEELYALAGTPSNRVWVGDFTPPQREWIERARQGTTSIHASDPAPLLA